MNSHNLCSFLQVPNFIAWDEDTCGIPGYLLHVGAIQWFWDRVVDTPSKQQCNLLLFQTDVPETVPHLMAWLPQPPNMVLLSVSHVPLPDVIAKCNIAFSAPPPAALDHSMLQELAAGFENGVASWVTLAEPRRKQQEKMLEERLRMSVIQMYRSKVKEKALKVREDELALRAAAAGGAPVPKRAKPEPTPAPVAEGEEPAAAEPAQPEQPQPPAEGLTEEEAQLLDDRVTPTQAAVQHLQAADVETLMRNAQDLLEGDEIPLFSDRHAAAVSARAKVQARPKPKPTPRKKAPAPRTKSSPDPATYWTTVPAGAEAATSSGATGSQQPSERGEAAAGAEDILLETLGLAGQPSQPEEPMD